MRKMLFSAAFVALMLPSAPPSARAALLRPGGGGIVKPAPAGTVAGRVTDKETGTPVVGVSVSVAGTTLGNNTDEDGRYRITGVPNGDVSVTAKRIGYASMTQKVTVSDGATATV